MLMGKTLIIALLAQCSFAAYASINDSAENLNEEKYHQSVISDMHDKFRRLSNLDELINVFEHVKRLDSKEHLLLADAQFFRMYLTKNMFHPDFSVRVDPLLIDFMEQKGESLLKEILNPFFLTRLKSFTKRFEDHLHYRYFDEDKLSHKARIENHKKILLKMCLGNRSISYTRYRSIYYTRYRAAVSFLDRVLAPLVSDECYNADTSEEINLKKNIFNDLIALIKNGKKDYVAQEITNLAYKYRDFLGFSYFVGKTLCSPFFAQRVLGSNAAFADQVSTCLKKYFAYKTQNLREFSGNLIKQYFLYSDIYDCATQHFKSPYPLSSIIVTYQCMALLHPGCKKISLQVQDYVNQELCRTYGVEDAPPLNPLYAKDIDAIGDQLLPLLPSVWGRAGLIERPFYDNNCLGLQIFEALESRGYKLALK